ncbi:MAG: alpha/beta hydrolase [Bacteroidota bacterium]
MKKLIIKNSGIIALVIAIGMFLFTSLKNKKMERIETASATMQNVNFKRDGLRLAGHLFLPPNFEASSEYPALIVQGSVSSVKEMMPDNYAAKLSAEGFVVLNFDYASWGESEGEPRQNENVAGKLLDLQAAVTFLEQLSYVSDIGMVGICTSGGNAAYLAAADKRVKAVSAVVPWMYEPALAEPFWGLETLRSNHEKSVEAKDHFVKTGENKTTRIFTNDPKVEGFNLTPGEYYFDDSRGGSIANWKNEVSWSSWIDWVEIFDPISEAPEISIPFQVFSTDDALIPLQAKKFYESLNTEKELVWGTGYHFDFYDKPTEINQALDAIVPFMQKHLD